MDMKKYKITLKHDNGKFNITCMASSKQKAINMALKVENAPKCAIVNVERIKKTYAELKAEKRQEAIEWQLDFGNHNYSWGEIAYYSDYFEKLGKRYGLLKEFRENGII